MKTRKRRLDQKTHTRTDTNEREEGEVVKEEEKMLLLNSVATATALNGN